MKSRRMVRNGPTRTVKVLIGFVLASCMVVGGSSAVAQAQPSYVSVAPPVAITATPSGAGYWIAASNGGIFTFGDAGFYGSAANTQLNKPIVGMASTPTGGGYWLAASDGGIFAYGDAGYYGSASDLPPNAPSRGSRAQPRAGTG
jgi:hypothetical protein